MNDKDRIITNYSTARMLLQKGYIKEGTAYVNEFVLLFCDFCKRHLSADEQKKTLPMLREWLTIYGELKRNGLTPKVRKAFALDNAAARKTKVEPYGVKDMERSMGGVSFAGNWCADVFERCRPSVAVVRAMNEGSHHGSVGTCFALSGNVLVTNHHVVTNRLTEGYYDKISVSFDEKRYYDVHVMHSDPENDVAVCKFADVHPKIARPIRLLADYSKLRQGEEVVVIGNGFDRGLAPFPGHVRYTRDKFGNLSYTAPSNPGDSGGPVLNSAGICVGINKSVTLQVDSTRAQGLTNATPVDTIGSLLKKWGIKLKEEK